MSSPEDILNRPREFYVPPHELNDPPSALTEQELDRSSLSEVSQTRQGFPSSQESPSAIRKTRDELGEVTGYKSAVADGAQEKLAALHKQENNHHSNPTVDLEKVHKGHFRVLNLGLN